MRCKECLAGSFLHSSVRNSLWHGEWEVTPRTCIATLLLPEDKAGSESRKTQRNRAGLTVLSQPRSQWQLWIANRSLSSKASLGSVSITCNWKHPGFSALSQVMLNGQDAKALGSGTCWNVHNALHRETELGFRR